MIGRVDRTDGIQRRGSHLGDAGSKLKQICDHPELAESGEEVIISRRRELIRCEAIVGTIRQVAAAHDACLMKCWQRVNVHLVFTQYRRMGKLLSAMIEHDLGCRSLFLAWWNADEAATRP